jgi:tetratricopeptide (TPR) repeat protein
MARGARSPSVAKRSFQSIYAERVARPEESKRGPIPWLRNRVSEAAHRAIDKADAEPELALQSAQTTLSWSLRHRGPNSAMTVNAKGEVAELLERLGRFDEALQLRSDIATHHRLQLGAEAPSTLTAEGFQAFDLERLGRHAEALPHFEHVLEGRTNALGPDDTSTLLAMEWLGCTHRSLGNLEESRRLLQEAVGRYERQGSGETEDCMMTMSHLATTLFQLEQYHEAGARRRHIFEVRSRTLGPNDPTTQRSLQSLDATLRRIEEFDGST